MANLNDLMIRVGVDVADAISGFNETVKGLDGIASAAERNFSALDKMGDRLTSLGTGLSVAITAPLAAIGAAAAKAAMDFDEASDTIRAKTGATGTALEGLEKSFRNVFADVPNSTKDVTAAISDLAVRLNLAGEPLERLSTQMLNLSRVSGSAIAPLIEQTTRAFGDWSIATDQQAGKLDMLFKVSQGTGVGITKLTELVVQFGAPLRALGYDFDTAATMFGRFAKEGVNTTTIMAGLRQALGNFAKAGIDASEGFRAFVERVKSAKDDSEALSLAVTVVGKRAAVDMVRGIQEGRFELDKMTDSFRKSTETINKTAEDTLSFADKFKRLGNQISTSLEPIGKVLLGIGEKAIDNMKPLLKTVEDLAKGFAALSPQTQAWALGIAAAAAAVGPLLILIGQMASGVAALAPAFALATTGSMGLITAVGNITTALSTGMVGALTTGETILLRFGQAALLAAAAFAGWKLGQWAYDNIPGVKKLGDTLGELLLKIPLVESAVLKFTGVTAGMERASSDQAFAIGKLEEKLKSYGVVIDKAGLSQEQYAAKLRAAVADIKGHTTETDKNSAAQSNLAPKVSTNTNLLDALGKKHKQAAENSADQAFKLAALAAQVDNFSNKMRATESINYTKAFYWPPEYAAAAKAYFDTLEKGKQIALDTMNAVNGAFNTKWALTAIEDVAKLANAFEHFGITSKLAFDDAIKAEQENLAEILNSEKTTLAEREQAFQQFSDNIISISAKAGKEIPKNLFDGLKLDAGPLRQAQLELESAMRSMGEKTAETYRKIADDTHAHFLEVAELYRKGVATEGDYNRARLKDWQATADEMVAAGKKVPATFKDQMERLAEVIRDGHKTIKSQMDEFAVDIGRTITSGLDKAAQDLLNGQFNLASALKNIWSDIAQSIVKDFIHPITDQIGKLMTGVIKDLIGGKGFGGVADAVKNVGTQIGKVFGGGASAAGTAAGAAGSVIGEGGEAIGSVAGATGSAGSSAGSAFGSIGGAINVVSGAVSAISSVVGNFQFAHMNTALGRIEESTRKSWIVTGEQSDSILKTLHDIREFTDDTRNRVAEIRPALFDPVAHNLEGIYDVLVRIFNAVSGSAEDLGSIAVSTSEAAQAISDSTETVSDAVETSGASVQSAVQDTTSAVSDSANQISETTASSAYVVASTDANGSGAIVDAVTTGSEMVVQATEMTADQVRAKLEELGSTMVGGFYNTSSQYDDMKKSLIGKPVNGGTFAGVSGSNGWVDTPLVNPNNNNTWTPEAPKNEGPGMSKGTKTTTMTGGAGGFSNAYTDLPANLPAQFLPTSISTGTTPAAAASRLTTDIEKAKSSYLDWWNVIDQAALDAQAKSASDAASELAKQTQDAADAAVKASRDKMDAALAALPAQYQDALSRAQADAAKYKDTDPAKYKYAMSSLESIQMYHSNTYVSPRDEKFYPSDPWAAYPRQTDMFGNKLGASAFDNMPDQIRARYANPALDTAYLKTLEDWIEASNKLTAALGNDPTTAQPNITINVDAQLFDLKRDGAALAQYISDKLKAGSNGLI